jgi:4-hydroxy-2-oxoheptanedioate aldolase
MAYAPASLPPNLFKAALGAGQPQIGLWSALCSNIASEIIAGAGFDWIVIDTEHAPNEIPGLLSQLQAMSNGTAEPVVRCAWNDAVLIKRILDVGARSLLVPFVQNGEEARRAVAATRYPPRGIRGVAVAPRANRYGRVADYHRTAHESTCVLVQVETRTALGEIEAIASVEGVDGIFIGPSDLAADFGHLANPRHPEVQTAIGDGCARIRAAGKAAGILTSDPDEAARYLESGFTFVAVGSDVGILARGAEKLAAQSKQRAALVVK